MNYERFIRAQFQSAQLSLDGSIAKFLKLQGTATFLGGLLPKDIATIWTPNQKNTCVDWEEAFFWRVQAWTQAAKWNANRFQIDTLSGHWLKNMSIKTLMGPYQPTDPLSVSCDRAIGYSGFCGVRETWVLERRFLGIWQFSGCYFIFWIQLPSLKLT